MENFKFILSSTLILVILGFSGYWAFSTIESGSTHVDTQKQKELEQKNINLEKQVTNLKREVELLQSEKQLPQNKEVIDVQKPEPIVSNTTSAKTPIYKYQSLINELQKLVDSNIFLKVKSQGPAVGTLQKFLNIYNNTSNKIDNDYGASTVTAVKNFQKAQGLTSDGEVGLGTLKKMITWLKSK